MKREERKAPGMIALLIAFSVLLLIGRPARAWDSYKTMAKEFSRAATRSNAQRIAVVPFGEAHGTSTDGRIAAERLTTQLARYGRVQLVERELLEKVMKEHYLRSTGAVQNPGSGRTGATLPVDAIVTGSVFSSDDKIEVHARMIDVESGRVLFASQARVERDWTAVPAAPSFEVQVPALEVEVPAAFRDALADGSCDASQTRVDDLERSVIEIKALYWASRMKSPGFSISKLTRNPGSEILSSELRGEFYGLLKTLYYQEATPAPTPTQIMRMRQAEDAISRITERCHG